MYGNKWLTSRRGPIPTDNQFSEISKLRFTFEHGIEKFLILLLNL